MRVRWVRQCVQSIYRLELYEILGIAVSALAIAVFFVFAKRLDEIIGISDYHWKVANAVVGMYQNLFTWLFTGAFMLLLLLLALLRKQNHQLLRKLAYLIRVLLAFCTMLAIYKIVNFYISVFNPFDRDIALQRIDRALFFGKLPAEWFSYITCKPLTDLFSAAYMSWFVLTYSTILVMMTHSRKAVVEFVFTAMSTFYIGYLTYIMVPAIGPIFTVQFAHPIGGISSVFTHDQVLVERDCFPSLHTGISLVMLISVWRYRRKWMWLYAPLVTLIICSTMYLRFHYGIDVIAGGALAVAMTQLCPLAVRWWEAKRASHLDFASSDAAAPAADGHSSVSELA
ncbi:phosphatase PAP2 family protein [Alicyclobacillus pomorum]|jgi:membrane-associated phospholipid phosphatase|uniref:phosphatase PAP2 family protein n=1 Tax=Alicyclobacillus pomorum TaxID=204470 RepID=UPI000413A95F|nr:phosphatase PAP2 family protein [Alicyclobacillus pomorum]